MFWGLVLESNKKYTQTIEKSFHLSMASLDVTKSDNNHVQVNVFYDNTSYLLCTLKKDSVFQVPLDLNFEEGTKISFSCNGSAGNRVYLTGYLIPEDDDLDFEGDEDDNEVDDDEEIPQLVEIQKKRKANSENDIKKLNKAKKLKVEIDEDDDDEEESDSGDEELEETLEGDSDDDEVEDEDDEDEDEDEEESDDDSEEVPVATPEKVSKKQKQKQNQQNQSQTKKLVNGKDTKPDQEQGKQKKNKENKDNSKSENKSDQQPQQKKKTIEGGVQIEDIRVGNGAPAKSGKFVSVYYVGRLKSGKKFDQTQQGEGFKFRLGKGEVIKGWDVGIAGMKIGGKRRITIPPHMAYGAKGSPPTIPPNSQLIFEVELKGVN